MEGLKQPRETKFGDPEITNDEQAIEIIKLLRLATDANPEAWQQLARVEAYLNKRMKSRMEDPEKKPE